MASLLSSVKDPKKDSRESSQSRKRKLTKEEEEEEQRLTMLLFGDASQVAEAEAKEPKQVGDSLFEIDREGYENEGSSDDESDKIESKEEDKPAWVDEDDANVAVSLLETNRLRKLRKTRDESVPLDGLEFQRRLRERYESSTQANIDWALPAAEPDGDDEERTEVAVSASMTTKSLDLPPNILSIVRCPDANLSDPNRSVVQSVNFHPGSNPDQPLLLTGGLDKTLRFFQVGVETSKKIHGIHFPKLPIYSAAFLGDSGNVVVSGRRPFFYIYDAVAGKLDMVPRIMGREERSLERCTPSPDGKTIAFVGNDGYVILVDAHTRHWIADFKLNGSVRAIAFTPDSEQLIASGSDGDVYRWDMKSQRCIERFSNSDGTITSSLAASSRHLAVGAESGVVNLYSDSAVATGNRYGITSRSPVKSIMNLHSSADSIRFNHDGTVLAMSTQRERNSMKLLHVPTATVFANWPTPKTPLQYVWTMDFSPGSKFFAIGNDKGRCLLYRLVHYDRNEGS